MPKTPLTPELELTFEEIRASMAIEGYQVSDATMKEAIDAYANDPEVKQLSDIEVKAKREGRSFFEVACEDLGLKTVCDSDDE